MDKNLRQRFARIGQVAKRNMGLTEKTQVLSNDLKEVEKKVELIQHACQKTNGKLQKCLLGSGQDVDKRMRKLPYSVLSQSMSEAGQELGEASVFGTALQHTSEACGSIASELTSHEMGLENLVLAPFNHVLENDIPSINSQRKKLRSLTIDMEAAKNSFNTAQRATSGGKNLQEHALKVEQFKEQYDMSQTKVEACKESLSTEMMTLVSKEGQFARNLLDMVEAQAQYHRNALVRLEGLIPKMKELVERDPAKPVYGIPLEEHLDVKNVDIAEPIQMCIFWLFELGIDEEGLFRIAGTTTKVKMIKAAFDSNTVLDMNDLCGSVNAVAGAFKQYLRDLPEPLLTFKLHDEFIQAGGIKDNDQKLQALWTAVNKMPKPFYNNFRYLIRFLDRVAKRCEVNKMTAANLSIVFGPNLLWSQEEGGVSVLSTAMSSAIIELFIAYAEWFFPGEIDFEPQEVLTKSNSFSETNNSSQSDIPEVRSPSPTTVASTPEKLASQPNNQSPSLSQQPPPSAPSNAAVQLGSELQAQKPPVVRSPGGQTDGSLPTIPDSSTIQNLNAREKEMAKRLGFLNVPLNKLKSASLPRKSTKNRHAPPIPGASPPTSQKRKSADSGINNSNETLNSIESTPSQSPAPSPASTPQKADRPPVPQRRDGKPPMSPVSPSERVPPVIPPVIPPVPLRRDGKPPMSPVSPSERVPPVIPPVIPPVPHRGKDGKPPTANPEKSTTNDSPPETPSPVTVPTSPVPPPTITSPTIPSKPPKSVGVSKPPGMKRPTMSPPPPPKVEALNTNHIQESFDTHM